MIQTLTPSGWKDYELIELYLDNDDAGDKWTRFILDNFHIVVM